jgi:hypothetical protein
VANVLYDKGREGFLSATVSWPADTIKLVFAMSGYTPNVSQHQYMSSVPSAAQAIRSSAFASKTYTDGIADAADVVLATVPAGPTIHYVLIFEEAGTDAAAQPLIAFIDTATGLPVTPNGGQITVQWDNAVNRIFKL